MTGPYGATGPTGQSFFIVDSFGNIEYLSGSTTVSRLKVKTTDYNRLPMGILTQKKLTALTPKIGTTFPTADVSNNNLIGTISFTPVGPTGPRNIRTHISLNIEDDVSGSTINNLYLTLYDDSAIIGRFRKTYRNASYGDEMNIFHYSLITSGTEKIYKLYGASDSGTLTISNNSGAYSANLHAPPSYITIEDIGFIDPPP
jgi:hypothetical protein